MTTETQQHNMSKGAGVLLASQDGTALARRVASNQARSRWYRQRTRLASDAAPAAIQPRSA